MRGCHAAWRCPCLWNALLSTADYDNTTGEEHDIIDTKTENNSTGILSKKEILHAFVLNRYPPLQQSTQFSTTEPAAAVDMEDIHAQHYPMLVHLKTKHLQI